MTLATYTDLTGAVPRWLGRVGDPNIAANVADWITLAEVRMNYGCDEDSAYASQPLRVRAMETTIPLIVNSPVLSAVGGTASAITLTASGFTQTPGACFSFVAAGTNPGAVTIALNGGAATAVVKGSALNPLTGKEIVQGATYNVYFDGAEYVLLPVSAHVPLPPGYLAQREIYFDVQPRVSLNYYPPVLMNAMFPFSSVDKPQAFTIEGDAIRFAPPPDRLYFGWVDYYQKIPALSAGTNWLMTQNPNVYLYGTLLEAGIFLGHSRTDFFYQQYKSAVNGLQAQDERDRHSGTTLTIRTDTGNP